MQTPDDLFKQREIAFCLLRPDDQAQAAGALLSGIDGVHHAEPQSQTLLLVRYDLSRITLQVIEESLIELGFHLSSNLMSKLKRALYYYTEETQRANMGLENETSTSIQVFINRYQRLNHGCRDGRPEHWRGYL